MFIVLEGPDGSGKTTLVKEAVRIIQTNGSKCISVNSFPSTPIYKPYRDLWINSNPDPKVLLPIVLNMRLRVVIEEIIPALKEHIAVVSDRWFPSTEIYQKLISRIPQKYYDETVYHCWTLPLWEYFKENNIPAYITNMIMNPDEIYCKVDSETMTKRLSDRDQKDQMDESTLFIKEQLIDFYNHYYKDHEYVVDTTTSIEETTRDLESIIHNLLKPF